MRLVCMSLFVATFICGMKDLNESSNTDDQFYDCETDHETRPLVYENNEIVSYRKDMKIDFAIGENEDGNDRYKIKSDKQIAIEMQREINADFRNDKELANELDLLKIEKKNDGKAEFKSKLENVAQQQKKSDFSCSICWVSDDEELVYPNEGMYVACPHLFHRKCLEEWIKRGSNCPLCNKKTNGYTVCPNFFNAELNVSDQKRMFARISNQNGNLPKNMVVSLIAPHVVGLPDEQQENIENLASMFAQDEFTFEDFRQFIDLLKNCFYVNKHFQVDLDQELVVLSPFLETKIKELQKMTALLANETRRRKRYEQNMVGFDEEIMKENPDSCLSCRVWFGNESGFCSHCSPHNIGIEKNKIEKRNDELNIVRAEMESLKEKHADFIWLTHNQYKWLHEWSLSKEDRFGNKLVSGYDCYYLYWIKSVNSEPNSILSDVEKAYYIPYLIAEKLTMLNDFLKDCIKTKYFDQMIAKFEMEKEYFSTEEKIVWSNLRKIIEYCDRYFRKIWNLVLQKNI